MKKALLVLVVAISFFLFPSSVSAALIHIQNDGNVKVNVLGTEDDFSLTVPKREDLQVKNLAFQESTDNPYVSLAKDGEKMQLTVQTTDGKKEMDVTNYQGEVVEIEERGEAQKVKIYVKENKFILDQGGVEVETDYPVNINPTNAELSVKTDTGVKYLSVLPKSAVDTLVRAKTITKPKEDSNIILMEDNGVVVYQIDGNKTINLFNVADYDFDVSAKVSASNGEVTFTNEPIWLKLMSLFLS